MSHNNKHANSKQTVKENTYPAMCIGVWKDTFGVKKATQLWIMVQQQKSKEMKWFAILATIPVQVH